MQSSSPAHYPDDSAAGKSVGSLSPEQGVPRPLDPAFGAEHETPSMRAAGAVVLTHSEPDLSRVALLRRQGAVCLPRVLIRPGESARDAAQRAVHDQVSPNLKCSDWQHLSQVRAQVSGHPLNTDYWSVSASDPLPNADCFWLPLTLAAEQLAFPEERQFLLAMEDPLIQSPPAPANHTQKKTEQLPPVAPDHPAKSHWVFDPHRGRLAESIAAARSHVESSSNGGDWRESALLHLNQAELSVQSGKVEAAQESLTHAWRLDLESRSVGERRLMTQLLRGEVRSHTDGWLRDSLLTALQESPDAGTMALVRTEVEKRNRLASQAHTQNNLGRLAQLIIALPVVIALLTAFTTEWLDGSAPAPGHIMPATVALGMLGGLGWSLIRGHLNGFYEALLPLAIGAAAAFFGLLLSKAGILTIGQDSAPLALSLAVLWGAAAAALVELKGKKK